MRTPKEFEEKVDDLAGEAVVIAEHLARKALKRCPYLSEFIMSMGMASFERVNPEPGREYYSAENYNQHLAPFFEFLEQWDNIFKITGEPMRFTKNGPKITDW